jgi:hypothetical protein
MHTERAKNLKARLKLMFKSDEHWLEKLKHDELEFLARMHPDLTETEITVAQTGRGIEKKKILRDECKNRYELYRLLRSKRRVPKNAHAEAMLKKMEKKN